LVEANIYPLAIYLDDPQVLFSREFFYETPNRLGEFISTEPDLSGCLRLIRVEDYRPGHHLNLVMDNDRGLAVAYLVAD
jgi:hypothetical protein